MFCSRLIQLFPANRKILTSNFTSNNSILYNVLTVHQPLNKNSRFIPKKKMLHKANEFSSDCCISWHRKEPSHPPCAWAVSMIHSGKHIPYHDIFPPIRKLNNKSKSKLALKKISCAMFQHRIFRF